MGNLILCHDKHATHPYEITRIHCRIFTMEELCYYLCNNLYLIDYTIMNEQICNWLEEEIGMKDLADQLRDVLRLRGSVEKFVLHMEGCFSTRNRRECMTGLIRSVKIRSF